MQKLSERTAGFTDSLIRRMTRISLRYGAVNLSQGFPDFEPPREILDRLAQVAHEDFHQYSITWGAQNFREALAEKQSRLMGREIDPNSEIVTTCGSTEAMMAAMMTVANPGDKVVIFSPFYENYSADTILSGAVPIYVPLTPPSFTFDPEVLEDAFRQHPKALVLCNPSNPCGKVFTREELEIIAGLAKKYDVYVITDEVYEHIVYAPHEHVYMATLPGMFERTVTLNGFSKAFAMTGWRIGYTAGPIEVIRAMSSLQSQVASGSNSIAQYAAEEALRSPKGREAIERMHRAYDERRRHIVQRLNAIDGLTCVMPKGAFYVMVDMSALIGKHLGDRQIGGSMDFADMLLENANVALTPGTAFCAEGYCRISYATSMEQIDKGVDRIEHFVNNLV